MFIKLCPFIIEKNLEISLKSQITLSSKVLKIALYLKKSYSNTINLTMFILVCVQLC